MMLRRAHTACVLTVAVVLLLILVPRNPDLPLHLKSPSHPRNVVVLTKTVYVSGHSVVHPELCPRQGERLRLLVLVASAPAHSVTRDSVRLTWGHFKCRKDIAIAFMLGQYEDKFKAAIEVENALYRDMIIGNFVDAFSNQTLKTLSMLEWASLYCKRVAYLLKTEDSMFINIPKLLDFLDERAGATKTIWGQVKTNVNPIRNSMESERFYVSRDQFPGEVYPPFTVGLAYILTGDCVPVLLAAAPVPPYVRLEDVFVTGVLAEAVGISRYHAAEFYNRKVKDTCDVRHGISIPSVKNHEQFDLWRKLLGETISCVGDRTTTEFATNSDTSEETEN